MVKTRLRLFSVQLVLPVLIIIFGVGLRFYHYSAFPIAGETQDELAWTMLGASIIQARIPTSWSHFQSYTTYAERKLGEDAFRLVRPAFDQPPLFSLLPGAAHLLSGRNWDDFGSISAIRVPMVLLASVNLILFYVLLQVATDSFKKQIVALLLFATIPIVVFSSRLVVAENLLTTWFLLIAITLLSAERQKDLVSKAPSIVKKALRKIFTKTQLAQFHRNSIFVVITVLCAAAVLTKISGLSIALAVFLYGLQHKRSTLIVSSIIGAGVGLGIFFFYGALYDWHLFWQVFFEQSSRGIGLATLHNRFFLHPTIVKHIFLEGWLVLGLVSVFIVFSQSSLKKLDTLKCLVLSQLIFIAVSVGESTIHGWYNFPLFPFLVIFIALWIVDMIEQKNFLAFWLFWLFILPALRLGLVYTVEELQLPFLIVRISFLLGGLPLLFSWLSKKYLAEKVMMILFILLIISNIVAVRSLTAQHYWEDSEYFLPQKI